MEVIPQRKAITKSKELPLLPVNFLIYANWKETEITAYNAIHNGASFEKLEKGKQQIFLIGTLLKISVISGCILPSDKDHLGLLKTEMKKFLLENNSYSLVTSEEILTAFRFNAAGIFDERIEHYQNIFNLDYLGKVLELWQRLKRRVQTKADIEQFRINLFEPMMEPKQPLRDVLEHAKDLWNQTNDFLFIPSVAFDYLAKERNHFLTESRKSEIREIARSRLDNMARTYPYSELLTPLVYSDQFDFLKSRVAKKIAVSEFFQEDERQLPISKRN
jgi:hypothetical protein